MRMFIKVSDSQNMLFVLEYKEAVEKKVGVGGESKRLKKQIDLV